MTLTAQGCGMGASIAADARYKLLALPGVGDADRRHRLGSAVESADDLARGQGAPRDGVSRAAGTVRRSRVSRSAVAGPAPRRPRRRRPPRRRRRRGAPSGGVSLPRRGGGRCGRFGVDVRAALGGRLDDRFQREGCASGHDRLGAVVDQPDRPAASEVELLDPPQASDQARRARRAAEAALAQRVGQRIQADAARRAREQLAHHADDLVVRRRVRLLRHRRRDGHARRRAGARRSPVAAPSAAPRAMRPAPRCSAPRPGERCGHRRARGTRCVGT